MRRAFRRVPSQSRKTENAKLSRKPWRGGSRSRRRTRRRRRRDARTPAPVASFGRACGEGSPPLRDRPRGARRGRSPARFDRTRDLRKKPARHREPLRCRAYLRVGLGVLQDVEEHLRGLLGPAALAVGRALVLRLRGAADATAVAAEDDAAAHGDDLLEVLLRLLQLHLLDGHRGLAHVLEVRAEVRAARLRGLGHLAFPSVSHHVGFCTVHARPCVRVPKRATAGRASRLFYVPMKFFRVPEVRFRVVPKPI